MRAIRWFLVAAVLVFSAFALNALVAQPWRCNVLKEGAQERVLRLYESRFGPRVARMAQLERERLVACLVYCPTDIDTYMTAAVALRIVRQREGAADLYRTALQYDRRPELFYNLGMVHLESGDREAARTEFLNACRFKLSLANVIPDQQLAEEVVAAVKAERERKPTAGAASRAR